MNKNTKTYILLGTVILIWGIIGYQVLGGFSIENDSEQTLQISNYKPVSTQKKEAFTILADYRDPFLGTLPKKKTTTKKVKKKPKQNTPQINIQYTGLITDSNTKNKIFFVTINGTQHLMNIKNKIQNVQLISGNSKQIKLKVDNTFRIIKKQE